MLADQHCTCQITWREKCTSLLESNQTNYRILVHPSHRESKGGCFAYPRSAYPVAKLFHDCNNSFQVDAVIENRIVAKNTEEVSANASAFMTAGGMRSSKANPPLNFPDRSQRDAPQDLDIVSWPARKRIPGFGKMPAYVYDIARGVDTYIYIIDNGINQDNAVSIQSSLLALSIPNTALGVQINAVAARPQRVALCLRCISEYDR